MTGAAAIRLPMWTVRRVSGIAAVVFALCLLSTPALVAQGGQVARPGERWVGTWATAVMARVPPGQQQLGQQAAPLELGNRTLRQVVHGSIGGERARVTLSNAFGRAPLVVGAASLALRDREAAIVAGSARPLTFGGRPTARIPAGATLVSDPVEMKVPAFADLAVDIFLPEQVDPAASPITTHVGAWQTNYLSSPGNHSGAATLDAPQTTESWFFLSRVEVVAPDSTGAVVTFGDSITDGTRSTPNTNNRWPNHLAKRLMASNMRMGVLNVGIAGNMLLGEGVGPNGLSRFDRDVLTQAGATHVVVLLGINDIRRGMPEPTAADLIAGHQQLITRARARGLKIYGATLTPFENSVWTPEKEKVRQAVNEWIRTSKAYDAVIDFDKVTLDPSHPTRLLPKYDSSDNIHPNDAGYTAMGESVDLGLFKAAQTVTSAAR